MCSLDVRIPSVPRLQGRVSLVLNIICLHGPLKGRARAGCVSCGIAILPCPRRPPRSVGYHPYRRDSPKKAFDRVSPDVGRLSPEVIVTRESLGGGHDDTAPAMTPVLFRDARGQRLQLASASEGRKTLGLFVFSESASLIFHIFSSTSPFFTTDSPGRQAGHEKVLVEKNSWGWPRKYFCSVQACFEPEGHSQTRGAMESAKEANTVGDDEETAVGIECYANSASGFQAILKERYTDFIVNEIGLDGEVVHLTSLDAAVDEEIDSREQQKRQKAIVQLSATQEEPDDHSDRQLDDGKKAPAAAAATPSETQGEGTDAKVEQTEVAASVDFSAEIKTAVADFVKLAGPAEAERLKEFLEQPGVLLPAAEGKPAPAPLILASSNDKAYRTSMHVFFNSHFQLMTDTVEAPSGEEASGPVKKDSKRPCLSIRVHPRKPVNSKGGNGGQKRSRDEGGGWKGHRRWPANLPQYLEFTLCKENKDTGDAIGVLSRILHVKPRSFGFAGTKDRRGVTSQRVTIFKVRAARMAKLRLLGMKVGNYRYVDRDLRLGDLKGNLFTLTLRGIEEGSQLSISEAVRTLRTSGFINYFGLQRFGSHSIGTHVVGAALLRGAWEEAVDLILRPRDGDKPQVAMARSIFKEQGNAAAALKHMPTWCVAERSLLEGLVRAQKNDYVSAFSSIPRTTRKMYVHAYQVRNFLSFT